MNTGPYCGSAEGGTCINNLLPSAIKQEYKIGNVENGDIKCEIDIKNFSIDIIPTAVDMLCYPSATENLSDDKFSIDIKNSSNKIQEIGDQDCTHDQKQKMLVKCDLNGFKLLNKDILTADCEDGACSDITNVQYHQCDFDSVKTVSLEQEKPYLKCNLCDYSSLKRSNVQKHIDTVHLKLKKFKCYICEYRSGEKNYLQEHIDRVHLKLKKFKCSLCDHNSADKGSLQRHINVMHLKLKKFKCHLCEYTSERRKRLQEHTESVHLKLRKFKCHLCEFNSATKGNLQIHIVVKHLQYKKFKCHLCDYRSAQNNHLQDHINRVHLKLKKFKCHLCEYDSGYKISLQKHINRVHLKLE